MKGNVIYDKLLNDKLGANLGYVYANVIAQMLRTSGKRLLYHTIPYAERKKFYEIDFVIAAGHKITPIEVKSFGLQDAQVIRCVLLQIFRSDNE